MMIRFFLAMALLVPGIAVAAGVDCETATQPLDLAICSNPWLSRLDGDLAKYYLKLKDTLNEDAVPALIEAQQAWLNERSARCRTIHPICLMDVYRSRILELRMGYENPVPYQSVNPNGLQGMRGVCGLPISFPDDLVVFSGGARSGRPLDRQIDESGQPATQFEVIVNAPGKSVALILGAHAPSIWNIAWTPGTRIVAVVATGYYRQAVAGLAGDVPILVTTHANRGPCGYLYVTEKHRRKITPMAYRVFDRGVTEVRYATNGRLIFGDPIGKIDDSITSKDYPPDFF